jgi:hypothetical protein
MSKTSRDQTTDDVAAKAVREWRDDMLARDFAELIKALDNAAPYRPTRDELNELVRSVLLRHKPHSPPAAPDTGARQT